MFLFQGVGARLPQDILDPLGDVVWPIWQGRPLPPGWLNGRFTRNLVSLSFAEPLQRLTERARWVQFLPLATAQILAFALLARCLRARSDRSAQGDEATIRLRDEKEPASSVRPAN
jgi:hypothetical protein